MKENKKSVRWQQRFQNLEKAFAQLQKGVEIQNPHEIEVQGIIQAFEFTFELSWKTLKDFLEVNDIYTNSPREVIKNSFEQKYIDAGDIWIDMLEKRNLLSHTYQQEIADLANTAIHSVYFQEISKLIEFLKTKK